MSLAGRGGPWAVRDSPGILCQSRRGAQGLCCASVDMASRPCTEPPGPYARHAEWALHGHGALAPGHRYAAVVCLLPSVRSGSWSVSLLSLLVGGFCSRLLRLLSSFGCVPDSCLSFRHSSASACQCGRGVAMRCGARVCLSCPGMRWSGSVVVLGLPFLPPPPKQRPRVLLLARSASCSHSLFGSTFVRTHLVVRLCSAEPWHESQRGAPGSDGLR